MMTSSRLRDDVGGSFASRRGHTSQLSISDPSHHVTEAIGTLYGDEDDYSNDNRPLSFIQTTHPEQIHKHTPLDHDNDPRRALLRSTSDQTGVHVSPNGGGTNGPIIKKSNTLPIRAPSQRSPSYENGPKSPLSPTLSLRDVQAESSQFPMTNIEHPGDIAQELSNLQALRRMSMDVGNNTDPDLLPFAGMSLTAIPSIAPSGGDDEADPSRLLWVPAAVHPELAPTEFKNFLEHRVKTIRRRSGGGDSLSPDSLDRSDSGGLRRKKSMLSKQIDNSGGRGADNYIDGAERLDSKRSSENSATELSLEELVKDPTKAVQKLAHESQSQASTAGSEGSADDMPILPMAPGMGLRRSTRTTYRKGGSIRSGERSSFTKRTSGRQSQSEDSADPLPPPPTDVPAGHKLSRVQSEPIPENFSRPNRSVRRQNKFSQQDAYSSLTGGDEVASPEPDSSVSGTGTFNDALPARTSPTPADSRGGGAVPQIVESSISEEQANDAMRSYPQRSSSSPRPNQDESFGDVNNRPASANRSPHASPTIPSSQKQQQLQYHVKQSPPLQQQPYQQQSNAASQANSLNDMANHPSPIPGSGSTRTDSLTLIPMLPAEERKSDNKKSKKDKEDKSSGGWSKWLKSSSDDKEKKRKEEEKRKNKSFVEKAQDNVRLDVLQNSIESAVTKGRESLLLDRDNVDSKLAEERTKQSSRKSDPGKKEKEGGLFSGLFGGSKRKSDKESASKKNQHLRVSEEPPYRPLRPDVDYPWTRYPLLEERAIYRMAHIKLANPRRSLASQVLLSNFMYNYLAIVQAMHPQVQVPQSPQQRRLEEERRRKEQEEQYLAQQQQMQQEAEQDALDQYNFEYHRGSNQYSDGNGHGHDGVEYMDEAQMYEYEHGGGHEQIHGDHYGSHNDDDYSSQHGKEYYDEQGHGHHSQGHYGSDRGDGGGAGGGGGDHRRRRDERDDMW